LYGGPYNPGASISYDAPVIQGMGYTGSGVLGDVNVTVGSWWINWSYDTNGTPTSHRVDIASDTGFGSIVWNYNVSHAGVVEGDYCNMTISNLTASTAKRYAHVRVFYGS